MITRIAEDILAPRIVTVSRPWILGDTLRFVERRNEARLRGDVDFFIVSSKQVKNSGKDDRR